MKNERLRIIDQVRTGTIVNAALSSGGVIDHAPVTLAAAIDTILTMAGQQLALGDTFSKAKKFSAPVTIVAGQDLIVVDDSAVEQGGLYGSYTAGLNLHNIVLKASSVTDQGATCVLSAYSPATYPAYANLYAQSGADFAKISVFADSNAAIKTLVAITAESTTASGTITGTQLISNIATGTAPVAVTSTTVNPNLNADMLDGIHASSLSRAIEDYSALCNGVKVQFDTTAVFGSGTTMVFLNGILQRPGAGNDYTEDVDLNGITFATAPLATDHLIIAYGGGGGGVTTDPVVPADIYIATTGNDATGTGTALNPYLTLAKALSTLPAHLYTNCTIHVADGTYAEPIEIRRFRCQPPILLKIVGNAATPANVNFTGTTTDDDGLTCGALISGEVNVELEGIRANVTATAGIEVVDQARCALDRCTITGTLSYGLLAQRFVRVTLHGNVTIGGWTVDGVACWYDTVVEYATVGTLTITGPGSGNGIHIYAHSIVRAAVAATFTITAVSYGFQLGLQALFQHIAGAKDATTITIDNAAKPNPSSAIQTTDLSSWSTNQAVTIDNFVWAFEANSVSYQEAIGTRSITNCTGTSSATQNSIIYLPA